jgi:hypothetical protein
VEKEATMKKTMAREAWVRVERVSADVQSECLGGAPSFLVLTCRCICARLLASVGGKGGKGGDEDDYGKGGKGK